MKEIGRGAGRRAKQMQKFFHYICSEFKLLNTSQLRPSLDFSGRSQGLSPVDASLVSTTTTSCKTV